MVGNVARNLHTGSRSEILADYLFSSWGTVTPVRRSDDHGVDLYCTLTEDVGNLSIVTDYYSVQVKSDSKPWQFEGPHEIKWLFNYSTPLFLACVDKKLGRLSVYQTIPRFLASFYDPPSRLELIPLTEVEEAEMDRNNVPGKPPQWEDGKSFSLSRPILRVSIDDLLDTEKLGRLREIFRHWVRLDSNNCVFSRMGILRVRVPAGYRTNDLPDGTGFVEQGRQNPSQDQLVPAVRNLLEVLDCVGCQLQVAGDRKGALIAALMVRHMKKTRARDFEADPRWNSNVTSPVEIDVAYSLRESMLTPKNMEYLYQELDRLISMLDGDSLVSAYLRHSKV